MVSAMASQITGVSIVCTTVWQIKENIKTPRHWLLWGESTDDQWIPLTEDQERGKDFNLFAGIIIDDIELVWPE